MHNTLEKKKIEDPRSSLLFLFFLFFFDTKRKMDAAFHATIKAVTRLPPCHDIFYPLTQLQQFNFLWYILFLYFCTFYIFFSPSNRSVRQSRLIAGYFCKTSFLVDGLISDLYLRLVVPSMLTKALTGLRDCCSL